MGPSGEGDMVTLIGQFVIAALLAAGLVGLIIAQAWTGVIVIGVCFLVALVNFIHCFIDLAEKADSNN